MSFKIFIQARMSSHRLPGKVLMPFQGKPIIRHIVDIAGVDKAVVLTSVESSDDPLAEYLTQENIPYFRGSLNDVHSRFCAAIEKYRPEWVMRLCADSPLIPENLISGMIGVERGAADLITNVHPRSFPKGHSVEIIRAKTLQTLPQRDLTPEDREHTTAYFYRHSERFKIINVTQPEDMSHLNLAVDTREDYDRLNQTLESGIDYDPANWKNAEC